MPPQMEAFEGGESLEDARLRNLDPPGSEREFPRERYRRAAPRGMENGPRRQHVEQTRDLLIGLTLRGDGNDDDTTAAMTPCPTQRPRGPRATTRSRCHAPG